MLLPLKSAGSLPVIIVMLAWLSRSTKSTFFPALASAAPMLWALVVLATPPFWFAKVHLTVFYEKGEENWYILLDRMKSVKPLGRQVFTCPYLPLSQFGHSMKICHSAGWEPSSDYPHSTCSACFDQCASAIWTTKMPLEYTKRHYYIDNV